MDEGLNVSDEIVVDGNSLSAKKQFLNRVFFPVGPIVCRQMGLVPASKEVASSEQHQSRLEVLQGFEAWSEFIIGRARWYVQGHDALLSADDNPTQERTLEEHLCAFALSIMTEERMTS